MIPPQKFWQGLFLTASFSLIMDYASAQSLTVVYPPVNHETTADSIFIIGSANANGNVYVNDRSIKRSSQGYFAPSIPLQIGKNELVIRYGNEEIKRIVTKKDISQPSKFTPVFPTQNISRLPNELICFQAIAPLNSQVFVSLAGESINLTPDLTMTNLPSNASILTGNNQGQKIISQSWENKKGCASFGNVKTTVTPTFVMNHQGITVTEISQGNVTILNPQELSVIEIISEQGVTRSGASTNHSRLTPLPQGTRALVTGKEGDWLRLDYGAWIKAEETRVLPTNVPPTSIIRSVSSRQLDNRTEVIFPLQNPVPISIRQGDNTFTLTLHNTTAETDTIRFDDDSLIKRLDWYQTSPSQVDYIFNFKSDRQWGYDVRYQGSNLILTFNHAPSNIQSTTILLDPGHGGEEKGSLGATGYPEKDVNLAVSLLLAEELRKRGMTVYLTRETDTFVSLVDRQKMINQLKPTLAFSIHYNALPDGGNAEKTQGVSTFWYHPQAHDIAVFMHNYLVKTLNRPSYGVYWNNLALTRPYTSPSILLELGFMINPDEFEWITNPQDQKQLAQIIANGITEWIKKDNEQ
ncbi:N-acetylmuramoyl-L-alanine amidase [Geminocystis sp. NIES-3709]|uniref:N-acetylmuramoyl-L-alanine amidase family protein n=1 Tax=Geminocystis sp. NIES-3709 TaxID=1617448 RepID=UPI0005FC5EE0|nr:N-acetylmuramoyl-L-alanine amidase [Geminocystis sp. NIES-3709]BAQ66271.1 N-acetylmuramoyl-L-alanine amidase [Geminocystis sp. NIES-3709]